MPKLNNHSSLGSEVKPYNEITYLSSPSIQYKAMLKGTSDDVLISRSLIFNLYVLSTTNVFSPAEKVNLTSLNSHAEVELYMTDLLSSMVSVEVTLIFFLSNRLR